MHEFLSNHPIWTGLAVLLLITAPAGVWQWLKRKRRMIPPTKD